MRSGRDFIRRGTEYDEIQPLLPKSPNAKAHAFSKATIFIYIFVIGSQYTLNAYGTILSLFLRNSLLYSEAASTIIYQLQDGLSNVLPLLLAIFADSIFGRYRTNVYSSLVLIVGSILLSVAAMSLVTIPIENLMTIIALLLLSIGQGAMISAQAPFGGDQYVLPRQQEEMDTFFSTLYFMINAASLLANFLTPILRRNVHCLGQDTCYSLGFGVPVLVMIFGTVIFVLGKRFYTIKEVSDSIIFKSFQCAAYALGNKSGDKTEHWLDKASEKFGHGFVNDLKALLRLVVLFSPLILFWSLWNQMPTTWTFQATRMSGYLTKNISLKPDQIQMTNSLLILFFIPAFELVFYPCLKKIKLLTKPLQRMGVGCVVVALSFVSAGVLELKLETTIPMIPGPLETSFNIINPFPCSANIAIDSIFPTTSNNGINSYNSLILPYQNKVVQMAAADYRISATLNPCMGNEPITSSLEFLSSPGKVHTFILNEARTEQGLSKGIIVSSETDEQLTKSLEGNAIIRIMGVNMPSNLQNLDVMLISNSTSLTSRLSAQNAETLPTEVDPERYLVIISFQKTSGETVTQDFGDVELGQGGSYLLLIDAVNNEEFITREYVLTPANSISVLWQLPQYALVTVGEILVSITGYQFAYSQAPKSMKSLVFSVWLWQVGMGDLVVALVTSFNAFPNQAIAFFFFAGLMIVGTIIFVICALRYEPRINTDNSSLLHSPIPRSPLRSYHAPKSTIPRTNSLPNIQRKLATHVEI